MNIACTECIHRDQPSSGPDCGDCTVVGGIKPNFTKVTEAAVPASKRELAAAKNQYVEARSHFYDMWKILSRAREVMSNRKGPSDGCLVHFTNGERSHILQHFDNAFSFACRAGEALDQAVHEQTRNPAV